MRCRLFLVHLVVIVSGHHLQPAAAAGASLSPQLMSRWCADARLEDFFETSEACQMAESVSGGVDCWISLDAVLQRCLDEAAAASYLEPADALKRNRNKFLGKRSMRKRDSSVRNTFLGKRESVGRFRSRINTFLGKQLAAENDEKRNRNKFLGKRTENDAYEFDSTASEKRSRNGFLGKRDDWEDISKRSGLTVFGNGEDDKRNRNGFLGKKDQTNIKRSRNKFLGK